MGDMDGLLFNVGSETGMRLLAEGDIAYIHSKLERQCAEEEFALDLFTDACFEMTRHRLEEIEEDESGNVPEVPKEKKAKAREWLTRAAKAGFDTAQVDLGIWLVNGTAGERDLEEGFRWLNGAAQRGNVVAQNKVAHLYIQALGTRPDPIRRPGAPGRPQEPPTRRRPARGRRTVARVRPV